MGPVLTRASLPVNLILGPLALAWCVSGSEEYIGGVLYYPVARFWSVCPTTFSVVAVATERSYHQAIAVEYSSAQSWGPLASISVLSCESHS